MEANELRIGNWVFTQSKKLLRDDITMPVKINVVTKQEQHKWKPIPLSSELLVKCGFKNYSTLWCIGMFDIHAKNGTFYYGSTNIANLHQLQNLYFALTGKELNIEL